MFYDNLTTHRIRAGLKIAVLARMSGVSATTIRRIEKHEPSTEETLMKLINALNDAKQYKINPIEPKAEIKKSSKKFSNGLLK